MKKTLLVLVIMVLPSIIFASSYESVTLLDVAVGFTSTSVNNYSGSSSAMCRLETQGIRYRTDGTAPTTTEGILINVGDVFVISGRTNLQQFKAISTSPTTTATLKCEYD